MEIVTVEDHHSNLDGIQVPHGGTEDHHSSTNGTEDHSEAKDHQSRSGRSNPHSRADNHYSLEDRTEESRSPKADIVELENKAQSG